MADPVNFTRPAAQRIARAVRAVEAGTRDGEGPVWDRPWYSHPGLRLKLGTFTGNWETAQWTTVTMHGSTQTVSVYNWCNPAVGASTSNTNESRYVIFGKVAGTQSAVEIQMRATQCTSTLVLGSLDLKKLPGFVATEIQMLGHGKGDTASTCSGGLQWYSITTCASSTAAP